MTIDVHPLLLAFPPQFAAFARTVQPPRPDAVPFPELLAPAALAGVIETYAAALNTTDRRAALSMWSQFFLLALLPAAAATALVGARAPDFALSRAGVVLSAEGRPLAVCLPRRSGSAEAPAHPLVPLFRSHLVPLAQALSAAGLPAPVFWSNAVHVLSWTLRVLQVPPDRLAELSLLLRGAVWPDGAASPLTPVQRAALHLGTRPACCLRHRLPSTVRCSGCPVARRGGGACCGGAGPDAASPAGPETAPAAAG